MNNLYIFPAKPIDKNGYAIAVKFDIERLEIDKDDVIVWYDDSISSVWDNDFVIQRPKQISAKRVINVLRNYVNCEISKKDLRNLPLANINNIFCGDVIFYRAVRQLFPNKLITVRFHNCFARIRDRISLIDEPTNLKFKIQVRAFYKLEKEVFKDTQTHKIFISNEDRDYYSSHFGRYDDSEVWGFTPDMDSAIINRSDEKKKVLVHYGGLQSHKIDSLKWFIEKVFLPFRKEKSDIVFHLYGKGSEILNDESNGIIGHGFYKEEGMPLIKEGLYINPDLIGGGVKIKLLDYFKFGASFITTPYGYEGYPKNLIDNQHYWIVEKEKWLDFIRSYFSI